MQVQVHAGDNVQGGESLTQWAQTEVQNKLSRFREYVTRVEVYLTDVDALKTGLLEGRFLTNPAALFNIRIALAEATASAVQFELQASGGKAYLCAHGSAFARRWRESAFVPIVTPSLVQLRAELLRQAKVSA